MFKLIVGLMIGLYFGALFGRLVPIEVLLITGIVLFLLAGLTFFVFHLGLRDFQGY